MPRLPPVTIAILLVIPSLLLVVLVRRSQVGVQIRLRDAWSRYLSV
jgi:hypothetical protein